MKTPLKFDEYKDWLVIEKTNYKFMGSDESFHYIFRFENGYGASIIKHMGSYGYAEDEFEMAVIYFEGDEYGIIYNTPITDDVLGYLNNEEVLEYLEKIKNLDRRDENE